MFLDLNGTLVQPLKPERLDDLTVIPGVVDAVARLSAAGFVCPIVTVQSRIAKGLFSSADFERWFARFADDLDGAWCSGCRPVRVSASLCRAVCVQEAEHTPLRACGAPARN